MITPLTMRQVAEAVGLSYDRFRKVWPELRAQGFPAPFRGRVWCAEAVGAWVADRSQRPLATPTAPMLDHQRARRQRALVEALRAG